jgi:hypothetical protein
MLNSAKSHDVRRYKHAIARNPPRLPHCRVLASLDFPGSYVIVFSNIPTLSRLGDK